MNSNRFSSSACFGGAAGCQGWQQFIYAPSSVFMQYWLIGYVNACPVGWNTDGADCWKNSNAGAATPTQSATNLDHLVVTSSAGSVQDVVALSTENGDIYAYNQASVLGLNNGWQTAEFNIVGNANLTTATFNAGSTVVVQTVTDSVVPTTSAPACSGAGFTGETNSLSLVLGSCCSLGGAAPGIQFTQSNVAGATAQPCPSAFQNVAVCGRAWGGLECAMSTGTSFGTASTWQSTFSDTNGWDVPQYYSTIQFADVTSDGLADVCGRGSGGLYCASSSGTSFGTANLWSSTYSDTNGWGGGPQYYSTIKLPDLNGDGKADVCGRGPDGIDCGLSNGTSFGTVSDWQPNFSDVSGWTAAQYYSTIKFPDVNRDGRADVCGRGWGGVYCAMSSGTSFGTTNLWSSFFSDTNNWASGPQYYTTIQFPDLDGDGRADVCGRAADGIDCALSNGTTFGTEAQWQTSFSDASGWNLAKYYSTLQFADINGDGMADVCGRAYGGIVCALSSGTSFGTQSVWQSTFSDPNGWDNVQYYSTLRLVDVNNDGKADICGRGPTGLSCALSTGTSFGTATLWQSTYSDTNGWNLAKYYSTMSFFQN